MMKQYMKPRCLRAVEVLLERNFLEGTGFSTNTSATSAGQEVKDYDFSNSSVGETGEIFNFRWEK